VSSDRTAGNVIARTDTFRLERDGTMGGLRVAWNVNLPGIIACMGLTQDGASVGKYSALGPSATSPVQVFTDSQNVVYYSCSFGDPGTGRHVTEVTMAREQGVKAWVGTLTSSVNQ
jgi:hypothetical protein